MHCESCSAPATIHVTEFDGGKPVARHFCQRHAAERLGGPTPDEWETFLCRLTNRFREIGGLPPVAEFAQFGAVGSQMAKRCERGPKGILEFLQAEVQKRLVV
jgi:hypothetical protein